MPHTVNNGQSTTSAEEEIHFGVVTHQTRWMHIKPESDGVLEGDAPWAPDSLDPDRATSGGAEESDLVRVSVSKSAPLSEPLLLRPRRWRAP